MCKPHWNQYTSALRKAALARKAADAGLATEVAPTESDQEPVATPMAVGRKTAKKPRAPRGHQPAAPVAGSQGDAG